MSIIISIDPGRDKCGLVLADLDKGIVLEGKVVVSRAVIELIDAWCKNYSAQKIILGNGTTSKNWEEILKDTIPIHLVEERGTTLRARSRYWELRPPRRWLGWLPRNLILPPVPLDAIAALVLLEDHVNKKFIWSNLPDFKIVL